ncbi:hypothetical protein Y032_0010g1210 [Ancylostoma ceylanicum]|uniref:Sushi domain-containing protein n=1 Tax=Ancylostoma ceylanicum TaxID=53326 RepID=A0A016VG23_9BILA|nr:hypothetical protein Y032_0010g1210 [Ancylostoma ceylanicum]
MSRRGFSLERCGKNTPALPAKPTNVPIFSAKSTHTLLSAGTTARVTHNWTSTWNERVTFSPGTRNCTSSPLNISNAENVDRQKDSAIVTCKSGYVFPDGSPLRIFSCSSTGHWNVFENDSCQAVTCPQIEVDISNSLSPLSNAPEISGRQPAGTMIVHACAVSYVFAATQQPLKIYECMPNGNWTRNNNGDKCEYVKPRMMNSHDL